MAMTQGKTSCRQAVLTAYRELRASRASDGDAFRACVRLYCIRNCRACPSQAEARVARWIGGMLAAQGAGA